MKGDLKGNISAKGKGFDGNPQNINRAGAPKSRLLKDLLTEDLLQESNGIDKLTAIINKLTTMAVKGDMNAIREVLDRYAGKSQQTISATVTNLNVSVLNIDPLDDSADHSTTKDSSVKETD